MLLGRGRWFCLVAVYLHERLSRLYKSSKCYGDGGAMMSPMSSLVGYMCYGRLAAIVAV
jgi:hypothetical protein